MSGLKTVEGLPAGVEKLRRTGLAADAWLVHCRHDPSLRKDKQPYMESLTAPSRTLCSFCKGDAATTASYTLPVKMIVVVHEPEPVEQTALF